MDKLRLIRRAKRRPDASALATDSAATSQLLSGNVPGTWHVKNRLGDWNTIYDVNGNLVAYAYWRNDRDKIVAAHNQALAQIVAAKPPI